MTPREIGSGFIRKCVTSDAANPQSQPPSQQSDNDRLIATLVAGGMDREDAEGQAEEVRVVGLDHRNVGDDTRRILTETVLIGACDACYGKE